MKYNKLLISLLVLSSLSLTLSFFSLIFSYGALTEVRRIAPYIQVPIAEHIPATAMFPITGAFVFSISISLALVLLIIVLLIFIFRK